MRADKTAVLAAERQQPRTAAEQAAAEGREAEYARDVPRTCICVWQFRRRDGRYVIVGQVDGCPWHSNEGKVPADV
jgi:hypothetical protein